MINLLQSTVLNDQLLPYVSLVLLSSQRVISFECVLKRERERETQTEQAPSGREGWWCGVTAGYNAEV